MLVMQTEKLVEPAIKKSVLVCIQAVDLDDPLMGFFVSWLQEASRQFSTVTVLALRVGRYHLPDNVSVIPFRPSGSRSLLAVIKTLVKESWLRRGAYDVVFVRGDPHYVLLAGWLWRLLRKKIIFWYAHYRVSPWAVLASACANVTVASVKASYDHPWAKPVLIGQNIDVSRFPLRPTPPTSQPLRCLVFGRIMPSKRLEEAIDAFIESGGDKDGRTMTIDGPLVDQSYADSLHKRIEGHPSIVWKAHSIPYDQLPDYLAQFDVLINAYPGSLDKTIVESALTGLLTIAATDGMSEWLMTGDMWLMAKTKEERVQALKRIYALSIEERMQIAQRLRERAIECHALESQIKRLVNIFKKEM